MDTRPNTTGEKWNGQHAARGVHLDLELQHGVRRHGHVAAAGGDVVDQRVDKLRGGVARDILGPGGGREEGEQRQQGEGVAAHGRGYSELQPALRS